MEGTAIGSTIYPVKLCSLCHGCGHAAALCSTAREEAMFEVRRQVTARLDVSDDGCDGVLQAVCLQR